MIGSANVPLPGDWFRVINTENEQAPAFAAMEVTGLQDDDEGIPVIKVQQPSSSHASRPIVLNGPKAIPAANASGRSYGIATLGHVAAWAKYGTGAPAFMEDWGPEDGSWNIVTGGTGFEVLGEVLTGRVIVRRKEGGDGGDKTDVVGGRLSLAADDPDVISNGATDLYYIPYYSGQICLHDGSSTWSVVTIPDSGISITVPSTVGMYDIFAFDNSGLDIESLVWTSTTSRATSIVEQDGILVKSGDSTRRYLGTIWVQTTGELTRNDVQCDVYNLYNKLPFVFDNRLTSGTHTYNSQSPIREWNGGSGAIDFTWTQGFDDQNVWVQAQAAVEEDGTSNPRIGIGLNTTTAYSSSAIGELEDSGMGHASWVTAHGNLKPRIGANTITINQNNETGSGGTATFGNPAGNADLTLSGWLMM